MSEEFKKLQALLKSGQVELSFKNNFKNTFNIEIEKTKK